jgi:hypothetical protein
MRNAGAGFASAHITIIYQISPDFTSIHYSIRDNEAQCRRGLRAAFAHVRPQPAFARDVSVETRAGKVYDGCVRPGMFV